MLNLLNLPSGVVAAEVDQKSLRLFLSNPQENKLLDCYFAEKRKESFYLGRLAAHRALIQAGFSAYWVISSGLKGEPIWPKGLLGSISHTEELALAVVTANKNILALGIDLELQKRKIPLKLKERICSKSEIAWCELEQENLRTLIIFSAKESIYKALYPLCNKFFGFKAVELSPLGGEQFQAKLLVDLSPNLLRNYEFKVKYLIDSTYIFSLTII